MIKEFRDFIMKGDVLSLAVAVILGGAFGLIVKSLVEDIIMPVVGMVMGGVDFSGLSITVGSAAILYGKFIQAGINFIIVAFVLFLVIKAYNNAVKPKAAAPAAPAEDVVLLKEIRDLLARR